MGADTRMLRAAALALAVAGAAKATDLPTAASIHAEMGMGWNIGNTMEVPTDPTLWGNSLPTQALIDSVKAAGFKTIRIPCAWYSHTESDSLTIKAAWLTQVKAVVDYCIKDSLFVELNSHWDNGWLESHVDTTTAVNALVKKRQGAYWRQIATTFKDYDRHLLFGSANEPAMQDAYGTAFGADRMAVLNSYHQTFIDSVRATGGNNATRTLVIQGPRTDIELTESVMTTLPTDNVSGRLMAEVHFYPYQFSLMTEDADWGKVFWYWGKDNLSTGADSVRNTTWCGEAFVDSMFQKMKVQFVDKGIPVIVGEFGAMKRTSLTGDTLTRHLLSVRSFYQHVVSSAKAHGIVPIAWDVGNKDNGNMTMFDRSGSFFDLGLVNAMRSGLGLAKLSGDTSLVKVATSSSSMKVLYSAKDSLYGQVNLGVVKSNFSAYDSIQVRAYVNGETNYKVNGTTQYGFVALSLVTMSKSWTWREVSFGTVTMDAWKTYRFGIGTDTANKSDMVPADPTKVDFFGLQAYSKGYHGTIYVDWIAFHAVGGSWDTLYTFDLEASQKFAGNVNSVGLIATDSVASDVEWKTATTSVYGSTGIADLAKARTGLRLAGSRLVAAGTSEIRLTDLRGRLVRTSTGSMELSDLPRGVYLATDGAVSLRLPLAQ